MVAGITGHAILCSRYALFPLPSLVITGHAIACAWDNDSLIWQHPFRRSSSLVSLTFLSQKVDRIAEGQC